VGRNGRLNISGSDQLTATRIIGHNREDIKIKYIDLPKG